MADQRASPPHPTFPAALVGGWDAPYAGGSYMGAQARGGRGGVDIWGAEGCVISSVPEHDGGAARRMYRGIWFPRCGSDLTKGRVTTLDRRQGSVDDQGRGEDGGDGEPVRVWRGWGLWSTRLYSRTGTGKQNGGSWPKTKMRTHFTFFSTTMEGSIENSISFNRT